MKTKRIKFLLAAIGMGVVLSTGTQVQASEPEEDGYEEQISPQYINIRKVDAFLNISGGTAECKGVISATSGKTCSVTVSLQKKSGGSWVKVKSWTGSGTGSCSAKGSCSVSKGVTYRVKAVGKCGAESSTKYSATKSY